MRPQIEKHAAAGCRFLFPRAGPQLRPAAIERRFETNNPTEGFPGNQFLNRPKIPIESPVLINRQHSVSLARKLHKFARFRQRSGKRFVHYNMTPRFQASFRKRKMSFETMLGSGASC